MSVTHVSEPGLSLDLPGDWQEASSDQPGTLVYLENNGIGSVTVMLLAVRPMFSIADRTRLLADYMDHRAKYEKGRMAALEQSAPEASAQDGLIQGMWSAIDAEAGLRQTHRVIIAGDILADVAYEAADLDEAEFAVRAASVLDSMVVGEDLPEAEDAEE